MHHAGKRVRLALLGCCLSAMVACADSERAASEAPSTPTVAGATAGWHVHMKPGRPPAPLTIPEPAAAPRTAPAATAPGAEQWDLTVEADPDIGRAPLIVQFTAVLDVEGGESPTFLWDFGDGEHGSGNPVRHAYQAAGEYTAAVRVIANDGRAAEGDVIVQVDAPAADSPPDRS
jgi:hypothetical protein